MSAVATIHHAGFMVLSKITVDWPGLETIFEYLIFISILYIFFY